MTTVLEPETPVLTAMSPAPSVTGATFAVAPPEPAAIISGRLYPPIPLVKRTR